VNWLWIVAGALLAFALVFVAWSVLLCLAIGDEGEDQE